MEQVCSIFLVLLHGETLRSLKMLQGTTGKQKPAVFPLKGNEKGDFQGGCLAVDLLWVPHKEAAMGSEMQGMVTQWEVWMCLPILLQMQWRFLLLSFSAIMGLQCNPTPSKYIKINTGLNILGVKKTLKTLSFLFLAVSETTINKMKTVI